MLFGEEGWGVVRRLGRPMLSKFMGGIEII